MNLMLTEWTGLVKVKLSAPAFAEAASRRQAQGGAYGMLARQRKD